MGAMAFEKGESDSYDEKDLEDWAESQDEGDTDSEHSEILEDLAGRIRGVAGQLRGKAASGQIAELKAVADELERLAQEEMEEVDADLDLLEEDDEEEVDEEDAEEEEV